MASLPSQPPGVRRSALLTLVVGVHASVCLMIVAAKPGVPQILEQPLAVELLQSPEERQAPPAKPLPKAHPLAVDHPAMPTPGADVQQPEARNRLVPAAAMAIPAPLEIPPPPSPPATQPTTAPRFDADYLRNPAPPYPPSSRRLGEEGKLVLRVLVSPQGTTDSIEVKASSGSPRLDEAAANTVRNWKFVPAKQGEMPVQSWVLVPIVFKLEY